jgi:hypothetical protein
MKKIVLAAAVFLTTAILTSCNRENDVQLTASVAQTTMYPFKKDLGSGD